MVSEMGPANRAPQPKPIRKRPVARDSVTSLTLKSAAACGRAAESTELAKPTTQPIEAMTTLWVLSTLVSQGRVWVEVGVLRRGYSGGETPVVGV